MAAPTAMSAQDPVRQFSVFAENRVGRLHDLTALFKQHNVHLLDKILRKYVNLRGYLMFQCPN